MASHEGIKIRVYDKIIDKIRVEELERRCKVGQAESAFLFMDTMGDPMCRIRNSPLYRMLVAEFNNELVGVIQGTIKIATLGSKLKDQAVVGYILGLRVSPLHRRTGIGSNLVRKLEEWFITNHVDFAYMATEKDNEASVNLFIDKLGFIKFRTPAILVNPVSQHNNKSISPNVRIVKLTVEKAEVLYRKFMGSTDFFPCDIDKVLRNKLSLGTWIAYHRKESWNEFDSKFVPPNSWAMLSVWNSCDVFKLTVGKAPLSWKTYGKISRFIDRLFPCFKLPVVPNVFNRFGFYFMYGVHCEGPGSGSLVHSLCQFVHNMARKYLDCKVIVTEVGGCDDTLSVHIPHWRSLSCPEDLWCIKALRSEDKHSLFGSIRTTHPRALFVDPREV